MQYNGILQQTGQQRDFPLLGRFFGKIVLDVLPAALASLIGGFLFTQYQSGRIAAPHPAVEQVAPASAEMMRLVRDEHAMIVDYLKAQMAAQKSRLDAEDEESARAVADAKAAASAASAAMRHPAVVAAAAIAPKPSIARSKTPAVMAVTIPAHPPLVIARSETNEGAVAAAPAAVPARDPNSLLAKTLDIKDHVVDATLHAVSAIGGIPSWIASMGDHKGDGGAGANPSPRQFSSPS